MKKNTQEKSLIKFNENGFLYKIKLFFNNLFHKKQVVNESNNIENNSEETEKKDDSKNSFLLGLKEIENEETKLLKLQEKYCNGEIKIEELNRNQILALGKLFDKPISELRKQNRKKIQQILKYRKNPQNNN